ncbi:hypothetical protein RCL_jg19762.t1 [Rhizophagus clarus]|uniref:Uncharacterized protein n=1 Tax=Rhizophagus clarus TaxID=94130 RepID=A0A8H3M595_9GLOM|nr:hypothetical protein RCL_jg19762.t1 [Rhizophagus clarus]
MDDFLFVNLPGHLDNPFNSIRHPSSVTILNFADGISGGKPGENGEMYCFACDKDHFNYLFHFILISHLKVRLIFHHLINDRNHFTQRGLSDQNISTEDDVENNLKKEEMELLKLFKKYFRDELDRADNRDDEYAEKVHIITTITPTGLILITFL